MKISPGRIQDRAETMVIRRREHELIMIGERKRLNDVGRQIATAKSQNSISPVHIGAARYMSIAGTENLDGIGKSRWCIRVATGGFFPAHRALHVRAVVRGKQNPSKRDRLAMSVGIKERHIPARRE